MDGSGLLSQAMQSSRAEWKASEGSGERGGASEGFGRILFERVLRLLEFWRVLAGTLGFWRHEGVVEPASLEGHRRILEEFVDF